MAYTSRLEKGAFGDAFLDKILDYITDEYAPDEVFGEDVIKDWIIDSLNPEDVFDTEALTKWALDNGFVERG